MMGKDFIHLSRGTETCRTSRNGTKAAMEILSFDIYLGDRGELVLRAGRRKEEVDDKVECLNWISIELMN